MDSIQYREAIREDADAIIAVQATTWVATYPNTDYGVAEADIQAVDFKGKLPHWQHMIASPSYRVWVAEKNRHLIGFLALELGENLNEINSLYVLPRHQYQGVGSHLMELALEAAGENKPIMLSSAIYNGIAVDFYKRYGFKVDKNEPMGELRVGNGQAIPTILMVRPAKQVTPFVIPISEEASPKLVTRLDLARSSGIRPSTIKYYTEIGILPFAQGGMGLRRYYDQELALGRLEQIRKMKAEGLSIPEIKARFEP